MAPYRKNTPQMPHQWAADERPTIALPNPEARPLAHLAPRAVPANLNAELADLHANRRVRLGEGEGQDRRYPLPYTGASHTTEDK